MPLHNEIAAFPLLNGKAQTVAHGKVVPGSITQVQHQGERLLGLVEHAPDGQHSYGLAWMGALRRDEAPEVQGLFQVDGIVGWWGEDT
ncbi:MAG: hypothetical protein U9Q70_03770, partial [Chloroflexota bacterium]|nr:hypothetical protein [Chloroflexota bacterium]